MRGGPIGASRGFLGPAANQPVGATSQNAIRGPSTGHAAVSCSKSSDVFQRGLDREVWDLLTRLCKASINASWPQIGTSIRARLENVRSLGGAARFTVGRWAVQPGSQGSSGSTTFGRRPKSYERQPDGSATGARQGRRARRPRRPLDRGAVRSRGERGLQGVVGIQGHAARRRARSRPDPRDSRRRTRRRIPASSCASPSRTRRVSARSS